MSYRDELYTPSFARRREGAPIPNTSGWQDRHMDALKHPRLTHESSIIRLLTAWAEYADAHKERYESGIGDDGVLGPAWQAIGENIRTLLNGETGRLDCGTLDGFLCNTLDAEGLIAGMFATRYTAEAMNYEAGDTIRAILARIDGGI